MHMFRPLLPYGRQLQDLPTASRRLGNDTQFIAANKRTSMLITPAISDAFDDSALSLRRLAEIVLDEQAW